MRNDILLGPCASLRSEFFESTTRARIGQVLQRGIVLGGMIGAAAPMLACSGNDGGSTLPGTGGSAGGQLGNGGGTTATVASGGNGVGGASPSSGGSISGGTQGVGGASSTGAGPATGGASTGGVAATGGNPTAGGSQSTGGKMATGGAQATGGNRVTGGASSNGGNAAGGAATGGGIATGGSATAGTCSTTLASRVRITPIAVSPNVNVTGIDAPSRPVFLAVSPNGTAKAAWADGTNVHVTPLDASDQRAGNDVVVAGSEVQGFVAHDDGSALLVVRGDAMVFLRLNAAGEVQSTLGLVGGNGHTTDGNRWIDNWAHQGRLAWSGTQYAAYFGQTGNWGSQGNHQGDHYSFISPTGTLMSGGWDWGCSHSLDVRLAHNGTTFAPICTSDTYPGAGIWFNNKTQISAEPSITNTGAGAKLGGLVPTSDGFYFTFTTPAGRSSFDVAFVKIGNNGSPSGKVYLTDTASVVEQYAYLAKYGDALLAGWATTTGALTIATLSTTGTIMEGPVSVTARVGFVDDFASFPNGDVGWAAAWSDLSKLQVTRVTRCP